MVTDHHCKQACDACDISLLIGRFICFCCANTIQQLLIQRANCHSKKLNKAESFSSCIISNVCFLHLFQNVELDILECQWLASLAGLSLTLTLWFVTAIWLSSPTGSCLTTPSTYHWQDFYCDRIYERKWKDNDVNC